MGKDASMHPMNDIIYEQPLNEHVRATLRLERLFKKLDEFETAPLSFTLKTLLDTLEVLNRSDLKTKWLQSFSQIHAQFLQWLQHQAVEQEILKKTLKEVDRHMRFLNETDGKFGELLRLNPFLQRIKHGFSQAGNDTSFDIPAFYYWQSKTELATQLESWIDSFKPLREITDFLLNILRSSRYFQTHTATQGFYEHNLENNTPCQLLRVKLSGELNCYPEMSASKQRLSIHFYVPSLDKPTDTVKSNITFELCECY